ncbi:hypothetical protein MSAN_02012000 [Mycena sanguinolenta]|uniref:GATA-type domain-containing protein n=1 Tax=Mycena sanguinolenta TaxID=230812 RepID=A0A8H6XK81_9AGAR|nr:hypothetical protein MSAN_02012000 [Mycena sanguinolenta]
MHYHRSVFNSNVDDDTGRQHSRHSRSNSGQQWSTHPGYMSSARPGLQDFMAQPSNPGGYYPATSSSGYPATVYNQPSSSFAPQYPSHQEYGSAYLDPRTPYINGGSSFANYPPNQFAMSAGSQPRMSSDGPHTSFHPTAAQPSTPWPYNLTQPSASSTNTLQSMAGYHPPASRQIQIPASEPGDYSGSSTDGKKCSHCHATSTPLWRRDPRTHRTLCNACALYQNQHGEHRPASLIAVDNENPAGGDSDGEYDGPECDNCGTRKTSTWRRNKAGQRLCNACGVYERMNGKSRPLALRNDKIRPRSKH